MTDALTWALAGAVAYFGIGVVIVILWTAFHWLVEGEVPDWTPGETVWMVAMWLPWVLLAAWGIVADWGRR